MTAPTAESRPRETVARTLRELAFLAGGVPVAVVSFAVAVAGLTAGVSLVVVWLGLPVLAATLAACRALADRERRAVERATGHALPPHRYRPAGGLLDRLRDAQAWRDALHAVVALPVTAVTAVVAITCTVGGLGGLLYGAWEWALPRDDESGLVALITGTPSRLGDVVLNTALGAALLLAAPRVLAALVAVRAAVARALLTRPAAALEARAAELAAGRRSAVRAEAQTLRRLERDLHDGPQQRLIRLGMDLETAGRRLDDPDGDPQRARALITEAVAQSHEALAELRALSRGIAPPILADRGLEAALTAVAGRAPVAVSLDVTLPGGPRPPAAVENAAYFVVTEALANVAKHARADRCAVVVRADRARLLVVVRDDGVGGAHLGKGHGLAGLADRCAAIDGSLEVVSPAGGPTVVRAELPMADREEA